jgi:Na+-driven multidrug efflux pump
MDDGRAVLTAMIMTVVSFKLITSLLIFYFFPSWHTLMFLLALSVSWIIAGVYYGGVYSRVKYRLLRARARRRRLIHQEWHVD